MTGRLEGKVVLVTGAASGIGRGIADAAVQEGATVATLDLRDADLVVDLADEQQVAEASTRVIEQYGRCDVLVHNAGVCHAGTVITTDVAVWDHTQMVNVRSVYLLSRALLPSMIDMGGGSIINIASNYATVGGRNAAAYCASKGAMVSLTRAMALDHALQGIRVNCICPGTVDTPLIREPMQHLSHERAERITEDRLSRHPIGRLGTPEDVAHAAVYLASDEAAWVTGSVFAIDGGYTAQ